MANTGVPTRFPVDNDFVSARVLSSTETEQDFVVAPSAPVAGSSEFLVQTHQEPVAKRLLAESNERKTSEVTMAPVLSNPAVVGSVKVSKPSMGTVVTMQSDDGASIETSPSPPTVAYTPSAETLRRRAQRHKKRETAAGLGGALVGGVLLGPVGLVAGAVGSVVVTREALKRGERRKDDRVKAELLKEQHQQQPSPGPLVKAETGYRVARSKQHPLFAWILCLILVMSGPHFFSPTNFISALTHFAIG